MKLRLIPIILSSLLVSIALADVTENDSAVRFEEARAILQRADVAPDEAGRAFGLMMGSANGGHVPAIAGVAYLYESGIGTNKSRSKAVEWYRRAAETGHPISQFNLAHLLVTHRQQEGEEPASVNARLAEGVEWYRRAADQGLTRALSAYGVILMRGDYQTTAEPAKAARYLLKAANDGDLEAMNALGLMYQSGNGVPRDLPTSETFLRKAAEAGHVKARANLGEFLDPNSATRERRIEAIAWLSLAAQADDPVAKRVIAVKSNAVSPVDMKAGREKAAKLRREHDANPAS